MTISLPWKGLMQGEWEEPVKWRWPAPACRCGDDVGWDYFRKPERKKGEQLGDDDLYTDLSEERREERGLGSDLEEYQSWPS